MPGFPLTLIAVLAAQAPAPPQQAAAAETAPTAKTVDESATKQTLAVMPVEVKLDDVRAVDLGHLLTSALTAKLSSMADYKVISADEVAELLKNESDRQSVGCTDASCLAELAGALGARFVVTGDITKTGSRLMWTASLVDNQESAVKVRTSVTGSTMQVLMAQVDEVALGLMGKKAEASLKGKAAQERLGLTSAKDLAAFRKYREKHAELPTTEAFTQFIIERNVESRTLAVAQAVTFSLGLLAMVIAAPTLVAGSGMLAGLQQAWPAIGLGLAGMLMTFVGVGLVATGLALTVVDLFNIGHVRVKGGGCCRQDAEIADAEVDARIERLGPAVVMLGAPVAWILSIPLIGLAGGLTTAGPLITGRSVVLDPLEYAVRPELGCASAITGLGFPLACACLFLTVPVSVPLGLLVYFWPRPDPVEMVEEARP